MELEIVSFETAKKLKKVGFDEVCAYSLKEKYSAPTLELVKMWFQKVHRLRVEVHICKISQTYYVTIYDLTKRDPKTNCFIAHCVKGVKNYSHKSENVASEKGILEAIKLIKK